MEAAAGGGGRWKTGEQWLKMAATTTSNNRAHVIEFVYMGVSLLGSFLILRWALNRMDPNKAAKEKARDRKRQLAKRLGRVVNLDGAYEDVIAQEVVNPDHISITLEDVGGLDGIIDDLRRNIITPMRKPDLFRTSLLRQKRGVLLYGPPGTGKTMLAKALARECGACFINIKASTLLSKWFGDTNKLVSALWSLAYKLQPAILFIDEVDALLGTRHSIEHEASTTMKTEFMQLWEGFETTNNNIVVLGATNRRESLDDAVLRRFSLQYEVKLPRAAQREAILRIMLKKHVEEMGPQSVDVALLAELGGAAPTANGATANGSAEQGRALRDLAKRTKGYSGSDLGEVCSQAAGIPVHEYIEALHEYSKRGQQGPEPEIEPLSKVHFEQVLAHMVPPSRAAQETAAALRQRQRQRSGQAPPVGSAGMLSPQLAQALAIALQNLVSDSRRGDMPRAEYPLEESDEDGY